MRMLTDLRIGIGPRGLEVTSRRHISDSGSVSVIPFEMDERVFYNSEGPEERNRSCAE